MQVPGICYGFKSRIKLNSEHNLKEADSDWLLAYMLHAESRRSVYSQYCFLAIESVVTTLVSHSFYWQNVFHAQTLPCQNLKSCT